MPLRDEDKPAQRVEAPSMWGRFNASEAVAGEQSPTNGYELSLSASFWL